jgi:hypothetical protein
MAAAKKNTTARELVTRFARLFSGLEDVRGTHGEPYRDDDGVKWQIKKTVTTIRELVEERHFEAHLEGKVPLGIVPINRDNMCTWGSVDIDDYDVDALAVVKDVEERKLPLVPCRSKSGGLHLFIFVRESVEASELQATLRDIAASLGFAKSEIFPKQTKILTDKGDHGSWILLPYYGGDYGGKIRMQFGLKKTGAEMTLKEFLDAAEKTAVEPGRLAELRAKKNETETKGNGKKRAKAPFSDGPPCLQHMAGQGIPQGGQNNSAFHMGVYYKRAHPENWQEELQKANQAFMRPPLPAENLAGVIRSLEKKDYEYKCKDQPMCSHCDSVLCRTRKHGVGTGGAYPEIRGLEKLNTEPAVWFVDIEDVRLALSTKELQNYVEFHRHCMEYAHKTFKMIPQPMWLLLVSDAMEKMTIMDASEDVGLAGRFREVMENFLTNRMKGARKEDLLLDRPWENEEEGRYYFTLRGLEKHLEREGVKGMKRTDITERIKKMEGKHRGMEIKGHFRNLWHVPTDQFRRVPDVDTPEIKGAEV